MAQLAATSLTGNPCPRNSRSNDNAALTGSKTSATLADCLASTLDRAASWLAFAANEASEADSTAGAVSAVQSSGAAAPTGRPNFHGIGGPCCCCGSGRCFRDQSTETAYTSRVIAKN